MRRPVQPLPISPKLLKHFAAATVVLTALIALFAGGEQSQLAQELAEREQRNQLAQTEAEKIGLRAAVSADTQRGNGSWGSAGPDDPGFSGASTDPNPPPIMARNAPNSRQIGPSRGRPQFLTPPPGAIAGGNPATMRGIERGSDDDERLQAPQEPTSPTADQAAALLQSSLARSGSSGDGD